MRRLPTLLLPLFLIASAAAAQQTTPLPPIKYSEYRLSNGLRVILHEDHSTPIVAVNVWYHVGSKNEVPGKTGFAHLFEHMMFQGSKNYPDDFFRPLQEAGGTLNGSTNVDRTNYWEVIPSNFLELALFLEGDRMGGLLEAMTEEKLANQRDVVKNEKRQRYDNVPYGLVSAKIAETLYPPQHPYHWLTIGSLDDLTRASMDDVKDFFRRFYTPNNASLTIAGDFDPAEAKRLVTKYFGNIPRGPAKKAVSAAQPVLDSEKRIAMEDRVSLSRIYKTWHTVPMWSLDEPALDILANILSSGKSSRLYKALMYDKEIAQSQVAFHPAREIAGTFDVNVTVKPGVPLAEIDKAVDAEIERIRNEAPSQGEVERAYNNIEASFIYGLQTVGGFGGKSDQLNNYAVFRNNPGGFAEDLARYRRVTPADVQRVARKYLTDKRLVVTVTPRAAAPKSAEPAAADPKREMPAPSRQTAPAPATAAAAAPRPADATATGVDPLPKPAAAAAPAAGAAPSAAPPEAKPTPAAKTADSLLPKPKTDPRLTLPKLQRRTLSNGLRVLIVEHHELPIVNLNMVVQNGAASDPAQRGGLATLTADLLDEGTARRSAIDISEELADIGARLTTGATAEASMASLVTLKRHLDKALSVYADVIVNAAFPAKEIDRIRKVRLTNLKQRRDVADQVASDVFAKVLFGAEHPYGHPILGDDASLTAIDRDDIVRFHSTYYRPNGATLIVAGDVSPDDVAARLEKAFAGWKGGGDIPKLAVSVPPARERAGIYLVDKPGAAQSVIAIGQVGPPRSTRDYFALQVMNTMLGGQFMSRVNMNLRENKGYTYGARTGFEYRRAASAFAATAGVQTAVTKESLTEFMKELRGIRGEIPVTDQELAFAKQGVIRGYPRGFETPGQIADRLLDLVIYDLPDSYFNDYIANVQAIRKEDIARVANQYLDPGKMAVVVVGDLKTVEPGIRSLEVGPVVTVDAEGRTAGEQR